MRLVVVRDILVRMLPSAYLSVKETKNNNKNEKKNKQKEEN